jgi:hypothetical protein
MNLTKGMLCFATNLRPPQFDEHCAPTHAFPWVGREYIPGSSSEVLCCG